MPERESFMKLRSSKAAICTGAAVVMFLMPVVPEVAVAKTTYEQPESTVQFDTELRQASYTVMCQTSLLQVMWRKKKWGCMQVWQ